MNTTTSSPYIGRWVTIGTIVIGIVGAALPVLGNMDFSSTSGIIAGLVAVSAVIVKYLDGWQKHEERQALGLVSDATASSTESGEPGTEATASTETSGDGGGDEGEIAPVTPLPAPTQSTPPLAAVQPIDDEEPEPGDQDDPMPLAPGDEVSDVPDPPTDDEIAAVAHELAGGEPAEDIAA